MRVVFADAGYWIAILDPTDELHEKAQIVTAQLGPCQIVTTEMVLIELLNFFSGRGENFRKRASETVTDLRTSPGIEVVAQTSDQFDVAVERYTSRSDKQWSVADCASFLLMEERSIKEALTHDRDFEQAGFVALLRQA